MSLKAVWNLYGFLKELFKLGFAVDPDRQGKQCGLVGRRQLHGALFETIENGPWPDVCDLAGFDLAHIAICKPSSRLRC